MTKITQADRERLSSLIEMVQAASDEGLPLSDCHGIWLSVLSSHRTAAAEAAKAEGVRAERERIVERLISLRETFLCCDGPVEAKGVSASIAVIIESLGVTAEVGT